MMACQGARLIAGSSWFQLDRHRAAGIVMRMRQKIYLLPALAVAMALCGCVALTEGHDQAAKGLKDVYAGKFLVGTAGDVPRSYSEAELANIKFNYNIITPENCMKPQPVVTARAG